jgi:hypothetical protein
MGGGYQITAGETTTDSAQEPYISHSGQRPRIPVLLRAHSSHLTQRALLRIIVVVERDRLLTRITDGTYGHKEATRKLTYDGPHLHPKMVGHKPTKHRLAWRNHFKGDKKFRKASRRMDPYRGHSSTLSQQQDNGFRLRTIETPSQQPRYKGRTIAYIHRTSVPSPYLDKTHQRDARESLVT